MADARAAPEMFDFYAGKLREAKAEMKKIIVGQEEMLDCLLINLITNSHCWLEGSPGLGKTLGVRTLAKILDIEFKTIQFTSDLLPLDIKVTIDPLTKSDVVQVSQRVDVSILDKFIPGVVFSNLLLIDEGNRAPQKVQAAMLEVMQERQVVLGAKMHKLGRPHMVVITTNDIEHEGTYNISEALADRIMLKAKLGYPSYDEERMIAARRKIIESDKIELRKVFSKEEIVEMQDLFEELYPFDPDSLLTHYAVRIVRDVRAKREKKLVAYGPTPRGSADLLVSASALAMLEGSRQVLPDHIKRMALLALRGTFNLEDQAEANSLSHDDIINETLQRVPQLMTEAQYNGWGQGQ